jgi:hypothetical protein
LEANILSEESKFKKTPRIIPKAIANPIEIGRYVLDSFIAYDKSII